MEDYSLARDAREQLEKHPLLDDLLGAVRWARRQRLAGFLRGVGSVTGEMSAAEREAFQRYVASDEGRQLLADFAEQATRTRSETALAALALLYANRIDDPFEADFIAEAAYALDRLTDRSIEVFLVLCSLRSKLETTGERKLVLLGDEHVEQHAALQRLGLRPSAWLRVTEDLIRRGLLTPPGTGGWAGESNIWEKQFAFSDDSERYRMLLERARRALDLAPVSIIA